MKSNSERTTSETSDGAHDVEKVPQNTVIETDNENIAELQHRISILGRLRKFELWLDKKLKIEPMGVERLSEEARRPPSILNVSRCRVSKSLDDILPRQCTILTNEQDNATLVLESYLSSARRGRWHRTTDWHLHR